MSIQAVSYVLGDKERAGPDFKGAELLVLIALANHTGTDDGECWPSVPTLARESRLTDKHVRECIRALINAGEIERVIGAAPDARIRADHRPNLYRLTGYLRARAGGNATGTQATGTRGNEKVDSSGTRDSGTKPSSPREPSSSDDDLSQLTDCIGDLIAAGKGPAEGKESAYLGRALGRHVSKSEAVRIMTMARELAAGRKFANAAAKQQAAESAERRLREAEARSRAEGDRLLGLGEQS